jgi:uncharacterized protein
MDRIRYNTFSHYLLQRYGERVWKIPVDAGFTCPNRDGHSGRGGCIFCRVDSFSKMESRYDITVREQIEAALDRHRKNGIRKYIVYFQASTNTYAPISILRPLFDQALQYDGVVGLSIATRPDCLSEEVEELLRELADRTDLWVELGLQSTHEETLQRIHRGHTYADYLDAVASLSQWPLRICCHLMLGLPGEGPHHILQTARRIAQSPIHEIKLHPLLVLQQTELEQMYNRGDYQPLTLVHYVEQVMVLLEQLPPHMVIQRVTAEAPSAMLLAPAWAGQKSVVLQSLQKALQERNSWQGRLFQSTIS